MGANFFALHAEREPSMSPSDSSRYVNQAPPGFHHSRRGVIQLGLAGGIGLSLPGLLWGDTQQNRAGKQQVPPPRAKSCLLFYLEGGPSHIDLWDMKPDAPAEVRGIYKPIATTLPGLFLCEHLSHWSAIAKHLTLVRSVSHPIVDHNAGTYYAMTGQLPIKDGRLITSPSSGDSPPMGSVLARLLPPRGPIPDFIQIPDLMFNNGSFIPGQQAGYLGQRYDPFVTGDPSVAEFQMPGLNQSSDLPPDRLAERDALLKRLNEGHASGANTHGVSGLKDAYERAFSLVTSEKAREAFDLNKEPLAIRQRYGLPFARAKEAREGGGLPQLGQSLLLARRLIEAGVRLVTVTAGQRFDQSFDTHRNHFSIMTHSLLPYVNQAFAAFMSDLVERGMLDETLVVVVGEFGRTPRMGQITSAAGATSEGRDHWPHCYSAIFAGGGIKAGSILGASDRFGGYPTDYPVRPEDLVATIYAALGLDPKTQLVDEGGRPQSLSSGRVLGELFA